MWPTQAGSQKSSRGGCFGGLGAEPSRRSQGGGGARAPPLACEVCKIARFWCFWGRFLVKNWKQPPPQRKLGAEVVKWMSWCGIKSVWISDFGRKTSLNFGEDLFFFFFFGDHLFLGGKNVWISKLSEKFRLNFRTNRVILIQDQRKFGSRSFALFSLFQKSPPLFQILATRLAEPQAAGGKGGAGGKDPIRQRQSSQRWKIVYVFGKNNLSLGLFWSKLMLLKRGIEISSAKTLLY